MAGALAGSATVLITNPIWVVNTRMTARKKETTSDTDVASQEKKKASSSTIGTLMSLLNNEGPQALFAGVLPALVLVINPILQYTIFEQLKNMLEARKRRVTPTDSFYLGAIGKLVATALTYPYLTVKSRAHVAGKDAKKENMLATLQRLYREEGWAGLYNGTSLHLCFSSFHLVFWLFCPMLTGNRNWTKSLPIRPHSRILIRLQGRFVRYDCDGEEEGQGCCCQINFSAYLSHWIKLEERAKLAFFLCGGGSAGGAYS